MKRILITGAGAVLGQGILRSLQYSHNEYYVVSADPDIRSTGHYLANRSYQIPYITENTYERRIEEIIEKEEIDIILIGTDVELLFFAEKRNYFEKKYNLRVVVSKPDIIKLCNDKWLTAEFLRKNGFPFPLSALSSDKKGIQSLKDDAQFPLIAKPIDGARSKGIKIIRNELELKAVCSYENNLVVQEMLSEEEGEFTTGCIVIDGECRGVVSLVRDLRDGNTWRAYRNEDSPYDGIIAAIAEKMGVEGPANFQYRIRNGQPVVFEVNCRFSGTTPIRMIYGFNEVEALLEYYLEKKPVGKPQLRKGTVLRTFSDIFVSNDHLSNFRKEGVTDSYKAEFFPFKK